MKDTIFNFIVMFSQNTPTQNFLVIVGNILVTVMINLDSHIISYNCLLDKILLLVLIV